MIGIIILFVFKLNLSIDFTKGTRIEILANQPLTTEMVSTELDKLQSPTDDIVISGDNK